MHSHLKVKLLATTFFSLLIVSQVAIVAHAHDPAGILPDRFALFLGYKRDLPKLPPFVSSGVLERYNLTLKGLGVIEHQVQPAAQTTNASTVFGTNVDAVPPGTEVRPQSEPTIAINPTNPNNIVIAYHDQYAFYFGISVVYSLDGGTSWLGPIYMPHSYVFDFALADPALTVDRRGNFYLAYISIGLNDELVVAKSADGGGTWKPTVAVSRDPTVAFFYDKPYIAAGPDPANPQRDIVYLSYTEFGDFGGELFTNQIKVVRSVNEGESWDEPVAVTPLFRLTEVSSKRLVQGSMPAVDSNGVLYVAYYDSLDDGWTEGCFETKVARSFDAGRTFTTFTIAKACNELPFAHDKLAFRFWSSMFPIIATGPERNVYAVFAVNRPLPRPPETPEFLPPPSDVDIMFTLSTDQGETWANLTRVNDDNTTLPQFFPWLAVDPAGTIHIIFGDTRDNPPEVFKPPEFPPPSTPPPSPFYHVYYAKSTDGGRTFQANGRVTDAPSNRFRFFIGDYFNIAASRESVQAAWTDFRLHIDIFTARLPSKPLPGAFAVSLKPARGTVGSVSQITGTASPSASLQVFYDGGPLGATKGDSEGRFSFNFTVPESFAAPHRVTAFDTNTGSLGTSFFTVQPSFEIQPKVALPGAVVSASGTGYLPQSIIIIWYKSTILDFAFTDVRGSFTFSFVRTPLISPFLEQGEWEIRAQDFLSPLLEAKATLRIPVSVNNILLKLNGTIATITEIQGNTATIQTTLGTLVGRVQSIEGNVVTVLVPGVGEIRATLQKELPVIEASQTTLASNIIILNVVTLVGAWIAVLLAGLLLRRARRS